MAEKQVNSVPHDAASLVNQRHRHIRIGVPTALKLIVPLAASLMLQGCTGSGQEQAKRKGGDSVLVFQAGVFSASASKQDTLVGKAEKLDSLKSEVNSRDSALASKMLQEMDKKTVFTPHGAKRPALDKEDMRKHLVLSDLGLAIDKMKQKDLSKAREHLASAENKMTSEEKKTDAVYLQLKALLQ